MIVVRIKLAMSQLESSTDGNLACDYPELQAVGGGVRWGRRDSYSVFTKKGFWIPQTCIQNYFALLSLDENSENCDMISQKRDSVKQFIHKVLHRLQKSLQTDSAGEKSKNKHGS
uniref:PPUP75 n=1 Tax=Poeciliopsis prolifica TaxID=188132 RepID=A0A0S7EKL3_9TELE